MSRVQASPRTAWFVHGMLEDERSWAPLVECLAPVAASAPRLPWSAQDGPHWGIEAAPAEWIARLDDPARAPAALMVAHSFGCNALLEHLLAQPLRQPGLLVLVSPFFRPRREDLDWPQLHSLIEGIEPLITGSIALADPAGRYRGELLRHMVLHVRDRLGVYGWVEFLKAFMRSPDLPLERLRCPVLVVSGTRDAYVPVASLEALVARLPRARLCLFEDGAHFTQITHARPLAERIEQSLAHAALAGAERPNQTDHEPRLVA